MSRLKGLLSFLLSFLKATWGAGAMTKKKAPRYFPLLILLFLPSDFMLAQVEDWIGRYRGPGELSSYATAIAIDLEGNVYVTGESGGAGAAEYDYCTIKYDREGNQVWVARYNGPGNHADKAQAMAVDSGGNVYVTGNSFGGFGTRQDYATIKYEQFAGGKKVREAWVARYNGRASQDDEARALAVDSEGNVYVTGSSDNDRAYATIKYDQDGNQVWVARYVGPARRGDGARALALDSQGNVYVTGTSGGDLSTGDQYATIKYDPEGNQIWVARYSRGAASAIAVDSEGNVYVSGSSGGMGTGSDYATVKYDPEGTELWAARYDGPSHRDDFPTALAVDAEGNVYVTGGSQDARTGVDYATVKYDPDGKELWVARYSYDRPDLGSAATALALDGKGNVYVTGYSGGVGTGYDYATVKYDPEGKELWVDRYDGPAHQTDVAKAIAIDAEGNVYVTGWSTAVGGQEYATIKYS